MSIGTFNIIGCGKLGKTIAKLFLQRGLVDQVCVCNTSLRSGQWAVREIGAGVACYPIESMPASHLWLIGSPDVEISSVAQRLAKSRLVLPGGIVFHCSGALSSEVLLPIVSQGGQIASVHPVRSFADVDLAVRQFEGTYCAIEGDDRATQELRSFFTRIGGRTFVIPTAAKMLCHAGHVFASNYLVALLECAQRLYRAAGITDELSLKLMEPLVRGAVENVFSLGTTQALTGPISRGDAPLVEQQRGVLQREDASLQDLYSALGLVALEIAKAQGLSVSKAQEVAAALSAIPKVTEPQDV